MEIGQHISGCDSRSPESFLATPQIRGGKMTMTSHPEKEKEYDPPIVKVIQPHKQDPERRMQNENICLHPRFLLPKEDKQLCESGMRFPLPM